MKTTRILVKSIPTCREYKTELACSVIELRNVFPQNRFRLILGSHGCPGGERGNAARTASRPRAACRGRSQGQG